MILKKILHLQDRLNRGIETTILIPPWQEGVSQREQGMQRKLVEIARSPLRTIEVVLRHFHQHCY
jgi:hypothetical protein